MPLSYRFGLLFLVVLAGVLLAMGVVRAAPLLQTQPPQITPTPLPDAAQPLAPNISASDNPTPSCIVGKPYTGQCNLTWYYLFNNTAPNYVISMTLAINNQPRARFNGFFQTSIFVPTEMLVFRVPCGAPGAAGLQGFGMLHGYALRVRDSSGAETVNFGSVICPTNEPFRINLPFVRK